MNDRTTGWIFVALQGLLLIVVVFAPSADDWPTPTWVQVVAVALGIGGIGVAVAAGMRLGPALTPSPVPADAGALATGGLYRFVRHPIYSGVLLAVAGLVLRSGSGAAMGFALTLALFFFVKSRWEEARLLDRYPGYADYMASTPRFVPRPWG